MKTYGIHFRLNRAPSKFLLRKYGGPLDVDDWRQENKSNRLWVIRTPNIERTFSVYECYLNQENSKNNCTKRDKEEISSKAETSIQLQISKRKTPAHFTKKSLLSLVKKA
jgi:hypothetical protein